MPTATVTPPSKRSRWEADADSLPSLRGYDFLRAVRLAAEGRRLDGLEAEVSQELERRSGRPAGSFNGASSARGSAFYLPLDAPIGDVQYRDLTVGSSPGGTSTPTDLRPDAFIDLLRPKSLVLRMGATRIVDMQGSQFRLPRKTASSTAYWISESNSPVESTPMIGSQLFSPRTVGCFTDVSRKLISSSGPAAQRIVMGDLSATIASEFDRVSLAGSGVGSEPQGLLYNADVPVFPLGTNGRAATWADVVAMERVLADANADADTRALGWLTTPAVREALRQTEKVATSGRMVWDDADTVAGRPAGATSHLPSDLAKGTGTGLSALIFGNWADLVLGSWGGIDVLVDGISFGTSGTLRVIAHLDCDVQTRHPESFVIAKDVVAA